jgi:hypothetical protein
MIDFQPKITFTAKQVTAKSITTSRAVPMMDAKHKLRCSIVEG